MGSSERHRSDQRPRRRHYDSRYRGEDNALLVALDEQSNPPVHSVFVALRKAFPARFDDYALRNKAFEVVDVLGWKTWDAYYDDVMSFA